MFNEYQEELRHIGRQEHEIAKLGTFYKVWETDPAFKCYTISSLKHNFEKCKVCVRFSIELAKAGSMAERLKWKERRAVHLLQCKGMRVWYETNKLKAEHGLCTSICLDAWSIWTTTCPHMTMGVKVFNIKQGLPLKVTGVIVHGAPGDKLVKFYVSDPTIPHDTSLNLEVLTEVDIV
jgi:hypothetical protein